MAARWVTGSITDRRSRKIRPKSGYAYRWTGAGDWTAAKDSEEWEIVVYTPSRGWQPVGTARIDGALCMVFEHGPADVLAQTFASLGVRV